MIDDLKDVDDVNDIDDGVFMMLMIVLMNFSWHWQSCGLVPIVLFLEVTSTWKGFSFAMLLSIESVDCTKIQPQLVCHELNESHARWATKKKTVPYFPLNPGFFNSDPYIMVYQNNPHIINWVRFNPLYIYTLNNLGPFLHCSDFSSENCYSCGTVLLVHRWQFNMSWVAQAVFSEKVKRSCPLAVSA